MAIAQAGLPQGGIHARGGGQFGPPPPNPASRDMGPEPAAEGKPMENFESAVQLDN